MLDGLGGLARQDQGPTELEAAQTPNLDALAGDSSLGSLLPVSWGITPGSGPGHFALFGYDPVEYDLGRGALEAAGIGFELSGRDVAVRANFATIDGQGRLVDRRAGRLPTDDNRRLCRILQEEVTIDGIELFVETVSEHRFLVVFRGDDLDGSVTDTDPQQVGVRPLKPQAVEGAATKAAARTADAAADFLSQAFKLLAAESRANAVTFRGFAGYREVPSLADRFRLNALCLANYPMYRGVARLVGMEIHAVLDDLAAQIDALARELERYDYFFLHLKATDKAGEDGDFDAKVAAIESTDSLIPELLKARPDVVAITGDHSTPSTMRRHSWHAVPLLLYGDRCRADRIPRFGEEACRGGSLGQVPSKHLMPLMLAHGGRLAKFGA